MEVIEHGTANQLQIDLAVYFITPVFSGNYPNKITCYSGK